MNATVLISPKEVCKRTSLARPTLDRLIDAGEFPKPCRITPKRLGFDSAAVEAWVQEKLQQAAA